MVKLSKLNSNKIDSLAERAIKTTLNKESLRRLLAEEQVNTASKTTKELLNDLNSHRTIITYRAENRFHYEMFHYLAERVMDVTSLVLVDQNDTVVYSHMRANDLRNSFAKEDEYRMQQALNFIDIFAEKYCDKPEMRLFVRDIYLLRRLALHELIILGEITDEEII